MKIDESFTNTFYIWYFKKSKYLEKALPIHLKDENDMIKLIITVIKSIVDE